MKLISDEQILQNDNKIMCDKRYRELYHKKDRTYIEINEMVIISGKIQCKAQLESCEEELQKERNDIALVIETYIISTTNKALTDGWERLIEMIKKGILSK